MSLNLDRSTWTRVRFGDVVRNVNDYFERERDGELPYVAGPHITPSSLQPYFGSTADDTFPPTFKRKFMDGDVLLHSRGIEKLAVVDRVGVTGEKLFVLRSIEPDRLDQRFLPFLMLGPSIQSHMAGNFTGSVNKFLNWKPLADMRVDLPPFDEQKRIADLLWAAEVAGRKSRARESAARTSAAVLFDHLVEEGERTAGWSRVAVQNLLTAGPTNGKSIRANDERRGLPTLSISAVRKGFIDPVGSVKYADASEDEVSNFIAEEGDFLVVRGNGNKLLTGLGGLVRGGLPEGCFFPDLLIRLRFDARVDAQFAALQWNAPAAHKRLLRNAKSTNGIWKINGKDIKSHSLVIPPMEDQVSLMSRYDVLKETGAAAAEERIRLGDLKAALLSEVF